MNKLRVVFTLFFLLIVLVRTAPTATNYDVIPSIFKSWDDNFHYRISIGETSFGVYRAKLEVQSSFVTFPNEGAIRVYFNGRSEEVELFTNSELSASSKVEGNSFHCWSGQGSIDLYFWVNMSSDGSKKITVKHWDAIYGEMWREDKWTLTRSTTTYSWKYTNWGLCDNNCEQTRSVWCECDQTGDPADGKCSGSKPATSRFCTGGDCPTNDDPDDGENPTTGITSGPGEVRRGDTTEISFWGKDNKNLDRYEIMIFDGSSTLRKENTEHVSGTDVSDSYEFRVENDWDLGDAPIEIIFWDAAGNMERAYHWYEILATLETYSWDESGDWSRCDSSCMQYIDIPCRKESDGGEVDDQKCIDANLPKPATSQSCTGGDCPELKTWYRDNDGDGYGDLYNTTESSSQPSGYVSDNQDCDDNDSSIHPGATEICGNGIDEDCDGADLACPASPIILDKVEIQNEFTGAMNMEEVHPLPLLLNIRAEAYGGNPDLEDVIPVRLEGAYTDFTFKVSLIETENDSHIYETVVQITSFSKADENTVAIVEDAAWGDGDRLIELVVNDGGTSYGKAHALGSINDFPPANISAMNAAGYERISFHIDESYEPPVLPAIFVKNQAKWFMYSGHGSSDSWVDMYDWDEYDDYTEVCLPNDVKSNAWADVETVIFACCAVLNLDKSYGQAWTSKGAKYYLGYRGEGPGRNIDVEIIERWYELVKADHVTETEAWMQANSEKKAWNASAYDSEQKKYFYTEEREIKSRFFYDQTVNEGCTVYLYAPLIDGATYCWEQISGQSVTLSDRNSRLPYFVAPQVKAYFDLLIFKVNITDDLGNTVSENTSVIVNDNGIDIFDNRRWPITMSTMTHENKPIAIDVDQGDLVKIEMLDPETIAGANKPADIIYLMDIELRVPPGDDGIITMVLPEYPPEGYRVFKHLNDGWQEYTNIVYVGNELTITLTDGGYGDDDGIANGIIVDPSGLGLPASSDSSDSSSSSGSSSSGSSKDCFIATVAYGSAMEPKVKLLREFRDSFLLTNSVGKKLVELYYHCSPPAADFIRDHEILRKLVGISLLPLVGISWVSLKLGATTTTLMLLLFVCGMLATIYYLKRKTYYLH